MGIPGAWGSCHCRQVPCCWAVPLPSPGITSQRRVTEGAWEKEGGEAMWCSAHTELSQHPSVPSPTVPGRLSAQVPSWRASRQVHPHH